MLKVLVIGGGFGAVRTAAEAKCRCHQPGTAAAGPDVTLVDPAEDLVVGPRLFAAGLRSIRVPLGRVMESLGVRLVAATVTDVDAENRLIHAVGVDGVPVELGYDILLRPRSVEDYRSGQ